ncbi:hypothetical protein OAD74_09005 [Alphaproteobacteria bacterium]|nr:hypothetical protein [Alphaproteobacteria bacterium]
MQFEIDELAPWAINSGSLSRENFQQEIKTPMEVFWREFCQNFLDVPRASSGHKSLDVKIKRMADLQGRAEIDKLLAPTKPWLKAAGFDLPSELQDPSVLIIQENHTSGLTGSTDIQTEEGPDEHWVNFWFTEGKQTKTGSSNGRRAQGKINYYDLSRYSTVFAMTHRETDHAKHLFGMCYLRNTFRMDGKRYNNRAWFCEKDTASGKMKPISDSAKLSTFDRAFGLEPKGDFGTTWIFPYVDADDFRIEQIHKIIIKEFYYAILNAELDINIFGSKLNESTLADVIEKYAIEEPNKQKIDFLLSANTMPNKQHIIALNDGWYGETINAELNTHAFQQGDLEKAKIELDDGKTVGFTLPLSVTKKGNKPESSYVSVYLKKGDDLKDSDNHVVRSSLTISKERPLAGVPGRFFGFLRADHPAVAEFLAESEDALHVEFNETRLRGKFENYQETLRRVRRALPQIVRTLFTNEGRDSDSLASIFGIPGSGGSTNKLTGSKRKKRIKPRPPRPPSKPVALVMHQTGGTVIFERNDKPNAKSPKNRRFRLNMVYQVGVGVRGDAFSNWSRFDFDLSDVSKHEIKSSDVTIKSRGSNYIEIEVTGNNPSVEVGGFNEVTDVRTKIEVI